jgi:hypothetical protein
MALRKTAARTLAGLLVLVAFPCAVWAQATAQISGTVRDQDGGVLPGVAVTVTSTDTGLTRTTITNETGTYALPNLPLGTHRLEASLQGFQTYVQTGILLQVNSSPVINPVLNVGTLAESVEVVASAAMVETRAVGVGQVMENERILSLPLNGRNVADLIVLSGQAVQAGSTTAGSRSFRSGDPLLAVGGGLRGGESYMLDGARYKNLFDGGALPYPFPDALQEFKVETSGLSAEHAGGASVSAVTRSGTNQLHGTVFEFLRNDLFNARSYFATRNSTLKRNQFGGTIGGPVVENRLFFFGGYQGTMARQDPADQRSRIPTAAMLAGDWTTVASPACNGGRQVTLGAPFVNNQINPAMFSRPSMDIARRLLAEAPSPDPCGEVVFGRRNIYDEHQYVGRVDYQVNNSHSLFGRAMIFTYEAPRPSDFNNPLLNANSQGAATSSQGYAAGSNYILSASAVNSLRFSANIPSIVRQTFGGFDPGDVGINAVADTKGYTIVLIPGAFNVGAAHLSADSVFDGYNFTVEDSLNFVRGRHQIGLGGSLARASSHTELSTSVAPTFSFTSQITGLAVGDFMIGRPASMVQGSPADVTQTQWFPVLYAQDAWQLRPTVTLTYGVRWEPDLPVAMEEGFIVNFDSERFRQGVKSTVFANAPAGLYYPGDPGFPGKTGVNESWLQFAPRVGAAWDVQGDGRTSVRASYGLGYDQQFIGYYNGTFVASPFFNRLTIVNPAGGFADPWQGVPGGQPFPRQSIDANAAFLPFGDYLSMPYDRERPRSQSWNTTVQRQFGTEWLAMASYVGTHGDHLWGIKMLNPALYFSNGTATCVLPNGQTITGTGTQCSTTANTNQRRRFSIERPQDGQLLGRVSEFDTNGTQDYHGLRLSLDRRAPLGLTIGGNYTYSRCLQDFTSEGQPNVEEAYPNPNDRGSERGPCNGSRSHVANITSVYELPDFANRTLRAVASGWRVSGIYRWSSGRFLNVTTGSDRALSDIVNQRPNKVLDDVYLDKSGRPLTQFWNPAAFAAPPIGTINGNLERMSVPGPSTWQLDMALSRILRIGSVHAVEFRAEAYNVTNSFRPGDPATGLNSPTFGQIRSALDSRILQFALKYSF